jgi:hypothetical protein
MFDEKLSASLHRRGEQLQEKAVRLVDSAKQLQGRVDDLLERINRLSETDLN